MVWDMLPSSKELTVVLGLLGFPRCWRLFQRWEIEHDFNEQSDNARKYLYTVLSTSMKNISNYSGQSIAFLVAFNPIEQH